MRPSRILIALALAAALPAAQAEDLVGVYHDALSSDPTFLSARAQYEAGIEKRPQARSGYLPLLSGTASAFRNRISNDIAQNINYNTSTY